MSWVSMDACVCVLIGGGGAMFLYARLYVCVSVLYVSGKGGPFLSLGFMLHSSLWADRIVGHLSIPGGKRKFLHPRFTT